MMKTILRGTVRLLLKPILSPNVPVGMQRSLLAPVGYTQPRRRGSSFDALDMNGVPARRIAMPNASDRRILYLHGGAYVTGSATSHRGLMSHLADRAGATVYAPEYRLAPEHPHPAAMEDSLAAYQWLLDQGIEAGRIFIGGDSAGGGLTLTVALAIRDRGLPAPGGLLLLSPWTDLSMSGASIQGNKAIDPMLKPTWGAWARNLYAGQTPLDSPEISPLFADLAGLPPMLIQVGSDEILLDDSLRFAEKAKATGVDVTLHQYDGMWHVFQLHTKLLRESMQAIDQLADFVRSRV